MSQNHNRSRSFPICRAIPPGGAELLRRATALLYPRLRQGQRIFWRDIHAVTRIYVSFFALFLLFTGLPWAKSWGAYLKAARHLGAGHAVKQDWSTSTSEAVAARIARTNGFSATSEMTGMSGIGTSEHADHSKHHGSKLTGPDTFVAIDTMVATVAPLNLPNPVLISPPSSSGETWTSKSDTRDRPLQIDLILDGKTGVILKRTDFHSKPLLDRIIGTGIAAHEVRR